MFPGVFAVFCVGEEVENEHLAAVVMDSGREAKIIPAHVEDGPGSAALDSCLSGVRKGLPGVHEAAPRSGTREPRPTIQRRRGLWEAPCIVQEGRAFDQT